MRGRSGSMTVFVATALGLAGGLGAQQFPAPRGIVSDFAGVIDARSRSRIEQLIGQLREETSAEVAVVTVETTDDTSPEEYAVRLFEQWGIGQKGRDNGVLILLAVNDRRVRIEPGYGLEGALPDGLCGEIIRQRMSPSFQRGEYGEGLYSGTAAVVAQVAREYGIELAPEGYVEAPVGRARPARRIFSSLITLLIILLLFSRRRFFFPLFMGGMMGRYWGGGSFGGGGFGGGFGGFGGGRSGGGGATGGW